MKLNQSPRFVHDCEACRYLGTFDGEDLYYCTRGPGPTLITRFGDEAPQYSSGMIFGQIPLHVDPPMCGLRVAYLIAQDMGWVT